MLYWLMKLQNWFIRFLETDELDDDIIYPLDDEIKYK